MRRKSENRVTFYGTDRVFDHLTKIAPGERGDFLNEAIEFFLDQRKSPNEVLKRLTKIEEKLEKLLRSKEAL